MNVARECLCALLQREREREGEARSSFSPEASSKVRERARASSSEADRERERDGEIAVASGGASRAADSVPGRAPSRFHRLALASIIYLHTRSSDVLIRINVLTSRVVRAAYDSTLYIGETSRVTSCSCCCCYQNGRLLRERDRVASFVQCGLLVHCYI